jgi:hypothetical protein
MVRDDCIAVPPCFGDGLEAVIGRIGMLGMWRNQAGMSERRRVVCREFNC